MTRPAKTRFLGLIPTLAALIFVGLPIAAQTARQGEPDPNEFHSPMVLDTVFIANTPDLWSHKALTAQEWKDLGRYYCDNVSIGALSARGKLRKDDMVAFELEVTMKNRKGHDKEVAVLFEVLDGSRVAASARLHPAQVFSGTSKTRSVQLVVAKALVQTEPKAPFRITVTARDIPNRDAD